MTMIENYLDSLERYLPDEMKQDVRDELTASLMDQVEDSRETLGRDLSLEETEALLRKLGHPMQVASAYLPKQQLISPDFFPAYKRALEIALTIMAVAIALLSFVESLSNPSQPIIKTAIIIFADVLYNGLYVFAIVTLIFYLMEYHDVSLNKIYAWSPRDLKSSSSRLALSRLETGFELIVGVLFLAWWNDIIYLPIGTSVENKMSLSSEWQSVFLTVNIIMAFSITLSIHKFVLATSSQFSLIAEIVVSLATLLIIAQILQFDQFVIYHSSAIESPGWTKIAENLDNVVLTSVAIVAAICAWDIFSNARKLRNR